MNQTTKIVILGGLAAGALGCNMLKEKKGENTNQPAQLQKPNILFVLADDLGYKDLGCYGSDFYETPNIDKLSKQGAIFMNAYTASAICSPTRASILTGKHPARLHFTDWAGPAAWHPDGPLNTPASKENLPTLEYTIAEALRDNGYATCYLGKWHLGGEGYAPKDHGFGVTIGAINAGAPPSYFYPYLRENWEGTGWPIQIKDLAETGKEGEYLTDRLTTEAIQYMDTVKSPFFVYFSYYSVHAPFEAKPEKIEKYRKKAAQMYGDTTNILSDEKNQSFTRIQQSHATYAGMIESLDENIGRLMKFLKEKGLDDNTIVVFTSDNGGFSTYNFPLPGEKKNTQTIPTSVLPLRAGKGWYYEGGIKIPSMIIWPGVTQAGDTILKPVTSTDFYASLIEMAGIKTNVKLSDDGISFVPVLKNNRAQLGRNELFWHFPHYHNSGQYPASAMRSGDFKLIYTYDDEQYELYNLKSDPYEKNNLADSMQDKVEELSEKLNNWIKESGAEIPKK